MQTESSSIKDDSAYAEVSRSDNNCTRKTPEI
jgi:hypothetical protein